MKVTRLLVSLSLAVVLYGGVAASAESSMQAIAKPSCTEAGCNGKIPLSIDAVAVTPYCSGAGCNGKNPQGTNCQSNAYRVYGVAYPIGSFGEVELWYSPLCNANWSRATGYYGQPGGVWVEQNGNHYPATHIPKGCSGNTCWSPMRNGTYTTRACGAVSAYTGCSPWA